MNWLVRSSPIHDILTRDPTIGIEEHAARFGLRTAANATDAGSNFVLRNRGLVILELAYYTLAFPFLLVLLKVGETGLAEG